ncbi:MAG: LCP family protein [Oculatellaceae cyanobacterium bins.114]|nr:LCP family protein [Oculatellaceae cyanobacterium bins.114]
MSATAGALVAVSIASTPLMQTKLSPEEAEVFDQGDISTGMDFRLPRLSRPVNILVLGVKVLSSDVNEPPAETQDLGYHALVNSFEGLSDTMLLLRFDPATSQLVVLSVPRDTRTWVEGIGLTKLNEANAYGGPALAASSTSDLLGGVSVDRYIRINVQGVEKLIDALGGVDIYVPHDMYYQDDSQHLYINLKEGEQHLDGSQALQFLRFRHDRNGDIGRIQRQQMMMRALMEQALSPATITRLPQILSVIQENLDTNLSVEELVALTSFASEMNRSSVQMLMLPGEFSSPDEFQASYWLPSPSRIEELAARYFEGGTAVNEAVVPDYVRVAIQDSTGDDPTIDRLVGTLEEAGYSNVVIDEPWTQPLRVTRIIAQDGDRDTAEAIRQVLGTGEVRVESTGDLQSDVTIQLGQDWQELQPTATNP